MKSYACFLIKSAGLILLFVFLLAASILSLSLSDGKTQPNDNTLLTPEAAVAAPTAQDLLKKKFDAYNTVTENDGKKTVSIYSEDQIADFRARRENGEWFWLSSEEMLFLIHDTVQMFETYDIVHVRSIDGTQSIFDCSLREKERECAITDVILLRIRALNSAEYAYGDESTRASSFFSDIRQPLSDAELKSLSEITNLWKDDPETNTVTRWDFVSRKSYAHIHYTRMVSEDDEFLRILEHYYIPLGE